LYKAFFSQDFKKHFEKLVKRDSALRERVLVRINDMMEDPFRNSLELTAAFKGKRRVYVGKAGYRLIYSVCKECGGKKSKNHCSDCDSKGDDAVVFFDILPRSIAYESY